ncbi:sulphate transporter [Leadbetterella byssophila DSM 17132]|uniref:Sulphate transporter n=2 Tax=Leadbetterella TaxID=319458 RepID=E4RVR9_LEAB4|nr:sulphate transporter [Leadbetterella byssophila DSM 17132]
MGGSLKLKSWMRSQQGKYVHFDNLKGDFFGGITAGIVALPLALAFGEQSGLGAAAGLYGAILIGFFASLLCSTQQQISGPTAPMTAVSVVVISQVIQSFDGNLEKALPSILFVFFMAGLLQILLGVIGFGKYMKYIPYPVISGFMTGIGVIIILTQLFPLLGYVAENDPVMIQKNRVLAESKLMGQIFQELKSAETLTKEDLALIEDKVRKAKQITEQEIILEAKYISKAQVKSTWGVIKHLDRGLANVNYIEFLFVSLTVLVIYGFRRLVNFLPDKWSVFKALKQIASSLPNTLVALVVVTFIAILSGAKLNTISTVPQGFPEFQSGIFTDFSFPAIRPHLLAIFSLAMLGSIDSLLTSVIVDNMTQKRHNPSQELISQGVGNSMSALFGGIPGSSATIRTLLNMKTGGETRISGLVASLLLLMIVLFLAPLASKIPYSVLSGVLITVGIGIMDYKGLKAVKKMPIGDVFVMFVVMLLTVFWDLVIAVGAGLIISALIFMKKMGEISSEKSNVQRLDEMGNTLPWDDETGLSSEVMHHVHVKRLEGPIFFGYTNDLKLLYSQIPNDAQYVIIRMDRVPYIDQSGLYALEDILADLKRRKKTVLLIGLKEQPRYMLERLELIPNAVPRDRVFKTFDQSLEWLNLNIDR